MPLLNNRPFILTRKLNLAPSQMNKRHRDHGVRPLLPLQFDLQRVNLSLLRHLVDLQSITLLT